MKKILLSLVIVCSLFTGLKAQEDNNDAYFVRQRKEFVLNSNGSIDYSYSHTLKLITYMASDKQYGESFVVFNPTWQQLSIHKSLTTMANGKRVKSPDNAFNEVLPQFAPNAPAFNQLREMVISHTGLEPGATVDLSYTLHSKKDFMPALMGNELLISTAPVKELELVIKVPLNQPLFYQLFNNKTDPVIKSDGVYKIYTWIFTNLRALSHEAFQSRDNRLLPRLAFSTAKQVVEKIVAQPAFSLQINESMKSAVDQVKARETNPVKIALALQELVVNNLTTIAVPAPLTGFRFRTPVEVWNSNYGNEPEKALLLSALLKQAGIGNAITAVAFKGLMDGQMINPMLFNEYDVLLDMGKASWLALSPLRLHDQDPLVSQRYRELIPLIPGKSIKTEDISQERNQALLEAKLALDANGQLTGTCNATWDGLLNPHLRVLRNEPSVTALFLDGVRPKDIKQYTISENKPLTLSVKYTVSSADALQENSGDYSLSLPQLMGDAAWWGLSELTSGRTEILELPAEVNQELNMTLTLPANYKLITPELKKYQKNSVGSVEVIIRKEGQTIRITRKLILDTLVMKADQVADLKALMNIWLNRNYRQLYLKKI